MKDKFTTLTKKLDALIAPYKKNIIIPLLKIIGIIIVCAILVRVIGGNETLADYAEKNPELAYPEASVSVSIDE